MIKDANLLREFEAEFQILHPLTFEKKHAILDALYEQAVLLGHFTSKDRLAGLEEEIELAKSLNAHVSSPPR